MRTLAALVMAGLAAATALADARTSYYEGQLALEEGHFEEAGRAFVVAGRGGYDANKVHLGLGRAYLGLDQPSRAIPHLSKALAADEKDDLLRSELAQAQTEVESFPDALATLAPIWARPDADPPAALRLLRGRLLLEAKDLGGAYNEFRLAIREYPDEVLELAERFPMEMDEALHELAAQAAAEPPTPTPTAPPGPSEPTQIQGLNRVGGVEGPSSPSAALDREPPAARPAGGGMHAIKGKASKGTKMGAGS